MAFRPSAKPPPDARIIKMRNYEEKNRALVDHVKSCMLRDEYAAWENKTNKVIENNQADGRYKDLKNRHEAALDERRQRLAEKLYAEEVALQEELISSQITPDERRAKLEARARELYAQREAERVKFADEMLYRQWRENCDGVRAGDSKAITQHFAEQRAMQAHLKEGVKAAEKEEAMMFDAMMERERLKKEQRYQQDLKRRKEREDEAVQVLNEQVADNVSQREKEKVKAAIEVEEMKARWRAQDEAHEAEMQAQYAKNKRMAEELQEFNLLKQAEIKAAQDADRAIDLAIVEEAMRKAREEEDREAELLYQKKEQDRMYRKHLALLMQKEIVSTAERKALIAEEQAKTEAKRQAVLDKENAARAKLMAEVAADRERQIAEHKAAIAHAQAEKLVERERMQEELKVVAGIEQEYQLKLRAERMQHRLDIEAQMLAKEASKLKAREEAHFEFLGAKDAEEDYNRYIRIDALKPKEVVPNFGRKSTKWFS